MSYWIGGFPIAAVPAHNVTYNMLLRARILSNYFRLEMLLVTNGGLPFLARMSPTNGHSNWGRAETAVGKSQGSS